MYFIELYSYTEGPEFALNRKCFEEEFREHGMYCTVHLSPVIHYQQNI